MTQIKFFVTGTPKPAGSKRAFVNKKTGKVNMVDASGQEGTDWRGDVKTVALTRYRGAPLEGPLKLQVVFRRVRPKSHYGVKGLKPNAPKYPGSQPDVTKLMRSLEDALTGITWRDDAQVAIQFAWRLWCDDANPRPGALVIIETLEN